LVRWGAAADELAGRLELLVGDTFMAAAVVNYLGAFPGEWCDAYEHKDVMYILCSVLQQNQLLDMHVDSTVQR
jgi:hypothetical protein